jgi:CRISPR-associated endonuclease/helicase Cas3
MVTTHGIEEAYARVLAGGSRRYDYQVDVARRLLDGKNLVLRAPTGAGKTLPPLVTFVIGRRQGRYSRLIYALPLRTLVRSIYKEAQRVVQQLETNLKVTMQTGEEPGDPFFSQGDIIVCTYDQLLSGLLAGPYGLSDRLANINAACITGALVVFDEFHLVAPDQAFLTGAACLGQFGGLTQSLWMSATATEPP